MSGKLDNAITKAMDSKSGFLPSNKQLTRQKEVWRNLDHYRKRFYDSPRRDFRKNKQGIQSSSQKSAKSSVSGFFNTLYILSSVCMDHASYPMGLYGRLGSSRKIDDIFI